MAALVNLWLQEHAHLQPLAEGDSMKLFFVRNFLLNFCPFFFTLKVLILFFVDLVIATAADGGGGGGRAFGLGDCVFGIFFFEDLIIVIVADGGGGGGRPFGLGGIVAAVCDCDAGCDDVKLVGALFDAFKVKSSPFLTNFVACLLKMVVVVVVAA